VKLIFSVKINELVKIADFFNKSDICEQSIERKRSINRSLRLSKTEKHSGKNEAVIHGYCP
jgi:hypothetical protein